MDIPAGRYAVFTIKSQETPEKMADAVRNGWRYVSSGNLSWVAGCFYFFFECFIKFEDDVTFEYHITIQDEGFNLGILTMRTPEGVFQTDFDE